MKLLMAAYHRNGVMGDGFVTGLFKDDDGTTKLFVDFGEDRFAVLDVNKAANGDIAFGSNSYRGDYYWDEIRDRVLSAGVVSQSFYDLPEFYREENK